MSEDLDFKEEEKIFDELIQRMKNYADLNVTYSDFIPILKTLLKSLTKSNIHQQDQIYDSLNKIIERSKKLFEDAEYRRIRDVHFFINALDVLKLVNKNLLEQTYKLWCEEFDKLNKKDESE